MRCKINCKSSFSYTLERDNLRKTKVKLISQMHGQNLISRMRGSSGHLEKIPTENNTRQLKILVTTLSGWWCVIEDE